MCDPSYAILTPMSYNIKFEDRTLRGLRVPEGKERQEWSDTVVPGLRFRKSDKGHGSFSVVYRVKGQDKQDRRTIGPFPRVSLAQAREETRQDLNAASSGRDPKKLRTAPPEAPEERPMTFAGSSASTWSATLAIISRPGTTSSGGSARM